MYDFSKKDAENEKKETKPRLVLSERKTKLLRPRAYMHNSRKNENKCNFGGELLNKF